jgi:GT2 family glycosyltransferase
MDLTLLQSETTASEQPLVCACVITYNGKRFLERCFQTLQTRTEYGNCRLVLVDNGSSDGSGDYVRQNFPEVDILRVFPNFGYAHGANEAIQYARQHRAKYIVLMNDDIEIQHSHWLREAIACAEHDPKIGIIGFEQVTPEDEPCAAPDSQLTFADYIGSPVLLMPVALFDRVGVFDEVYFVMADDDDLTARAQAAGYRTALLNIPVIHFGGGTNQVCSYRTAYLQMRNGIRFSLKHQSPLHALLRALRIIDLACNPWPLTFDKHNGAHRNIRNSGNVFVNFVLWFRAVAWNVFRLPQTIRIRAAERRITRAALEAPERPSNGPSYRADAEPAGQLTC